MVKSPKSSGGFDSILVLVDHIPEGAHFIPALTSSQLANHERLHVLLADAPAVSPTLAAVCAHSRLLTHRAPTEARLARPGGGRKGEGEGEGSDEQTKEERNSPLKLNSRSNRPTLDERRPHTDTRIQEEPESTHSCLSYTYQVVRPG